MTMAEIEAALIQNINLLCLLFVLFPYLNALYTPCDLEQAQIHENTHTDAFIA